MLFPHNLPFIISMTVFWLVLLIFTMPFDLAVLFLFLALLIMSLQLLLFATKNNSEKVLPEF